MRSIVLGVSLALFSAACGQSAELTGNAKVKQDQRLATSPSPAPEKEQASAAVDGAIAKSEPLALERSFNTLEATDAEVTYDPSAKFFEQRVALKHRTASGSTTLGQTERLPVTKEFQQGAPGALRTETFAQAGLGLLDLVVVIDNSGSMKQEQVNLASKLDPLLQYIQNSDWRINVVTTDPANGCSRALIKKGDANVNAAFSAAVLAGLAGTGNEQGIRQSVTAFSCTTPAWVRANSSLATLIVSDEDNCSNGTGCAAPFNNISHLLGHMSGTMGRTLGTNARVYGLIWVPGTTCNGGGSQGNQYASAVTATNGVMGSICNPDYSTTLRAISENVASILTAQFELNVTPDAGTLQVKVNGVVAAPATYTLAGKTVTFSTLPPANATVVATYNIGSTPILKRFALDQTPAPSTVSVRVNGVIAATNSYSVNANNEVVFTTAPVASANIRASFRANTALPNELPFATAVMAGSLKVNVNGVPDANVTQANGKLVFSAAPIDNAFIDVTYTEDLGPQYTYDTAGGVNTKLISLTDAATGDGITGATLVGKKLTIKEGDYADNRSLTLRYRDERSEAFTIVLADAPLADSLAVDGDGCSIVSTQAAASGGPVVTLDCQDLSPIVLTYRRALAHLDSFSLPEVLTPEAGIWTVFFDDQPLIDFARTGSTITLPQALRDQLAAAAEPHVVRISYTQD